MTAARVFKPENRLARILNNHTGKAARDLISDADEHVERLADSIRGFVAGKVRTLARFGDASEDLLFAESRAIGKHALDVAEVAGAAGLGLVGDIARGIAAMVDGLVRDGIWHSDALRLHIRSLQLVHNAPLACEGGEQDMVDHLFAMRQALGVRE